jgi:hypothetical protein
MHNDRRHACQAVVKKALRSGRGNSDCVFEQEPSIHGDEGTSQSRRHGNSAAAD